MTNLVDLSNKHVVVTGASSGLGRQTCIKLSQLGAKVSMIARNEGKMNETLAEMEGAGHKAFPFDVNQIEGIESLIGSIVEQNGKIDGFVHAAGNGTIKPVSMTKYDFMLEIMKIHLFSFVEFSRVISKKKYSNDWASFVAVSSAGTIRSGGGKVAYSTTKGALDATIRPFAIELGNKRFFRFNTINPGWIRTPMFDQTIVELGQERVDEMMRDQFLGLAEPEDIANCIAFLLSNASRMITGQNIVIDGGFTLQ